MIRLPADLILVVINPGWQLVCVSTWNSNTRSFRTLVAFSCCPILYGQIDTTFIYTPVTTFWLSRLRYPRHPPMDPS